MRLNIEGVLKIPTLIQMSDILTHSASGTFYIININNTVIDREVNIVTILRLQNSLFGIVSFERAGKRDGCKGAQIT